MFLLLLLHFSLFFQLFLFANSLSSKDFIEMQTSFTGLHSGCIVQVATDYHEVNIESGSEETDQHYSYFSVHQVKVSH